MSYSTRCRRCGDSRGYIGAVDAEVFKRAHMGALDHSWGSGEPGHTVEVQRADGTVRAVVGVKRLRRSA